MEAQIQNYRNLIVLGDNYLAKTDCKRFVQHLMWIEAMLDRAKVEIAEMSTSTAESETSRAFTKEVYLYLDNVIRPKTSEIIKSMSEEERNSLAGALRMSSSNDAQWAKAT